jgi:hypothetical protein
MTGVFNTVGHATEPAAREASSQLLNAVSEVVQMLSAAEVHGLDTTEQLRMRALADLQRTRERFGQLQSTSVSLRSSNQIDDSSQRELGSLYGQLAGLEGIGTVAITAQDLLNIAPQQINRLSSTVADARFGRGGADWETYRDVINAIKDLLTAGVAVSRIFYLHGRESTLGR